MRETISKADLEALAKALEWLDGTLLKPGRKSWVEVRHSYGSCFAKNVRYRTAIVFVERVGNSNNTSERVRWAGVGPGPVSSAADLIRQMRHELPAQAWESNSKRTSAKVIPFRRSK